MARDPAAAIDAQASAQAPKPPQDPNRKSSTSRSFVCRSERERRIQGDGIRERARTRRAGVPHQIHLATQHRSLESSGQSRSVALEIRSRLRSVGTDKQRVARRDRDTPRRIGTVSGPDVQPRELVAPSRNSSPKHLWHLWNSWHPWNLYETRAWLGSDGTDRCASQPPVAPPAILSTCAT